jgi:uncharacterized membrane protein
MFFKKRPRNLISGSATLTFVVLILTVAGVLLIVVMAGKEGSQGNQDLAEKMRKVAVIKQAYITYAAEKGHFPPPDPFGCDMNDTSASRCAGKGHYASTDPDLTHTPRSDQVLRSAGTYPVLFGGVPNVDLNIGEEFTHHNGKKIVVAVVEDATIDRTICEALQEEALTNPGIAPIHISDGTGQINTVFLVIYIPDGGHGTVSVNGGTWQSLIDTGATDATTLANTIDPDTVTAASSITFIDKPETATYRGLVAYLEDYPRTCCPLCTSSVSNQPGFHLQAPSGQFSGISQASGDVNGDGKLDLVLGSPFENRVYVILGVNTVYPTPVMLNDLNGVNGFIVSGSFTSPAAHLFGWDVEVADLNADGYAEVIITDRNPFTAVCPQPAGHYVRILFGQAAPRIGGVTFTDTGVSAGAVAAFVGGAGLQPNFGWAVAAARLNNDNYYDLAISDLRGTVYVLYGKASANWTFVSSGIEDANLIGTSVPGFRITADGTSTYAQAPTATQNFAYSLGRLPADPAASNGVAGANPYDGLIIGMPALSFPGLNRAGGFYVIRSPESYVDFPSVYSLSALGVSGHLFRYTTANAHAGVSVAGGDINADGFSDPIGSAAGQHSLLTLATSGTTGSLYCCSAYAGSVGVVLGANGGFTAGASDVAYFINGTAGQSFGTSVAVFNMNGDSVGSYQKDDIIIGAPTAGGGNRGKVYVVYAPSNGLAVNAGTVDGVVSASFTGDPGDFIGFTVGEAMEVNGPNYRALCMTAPGKFTSSGAATVAAGGPIPTASDTTVDSFD